MPNWCFTSYTFNGSKEKVEWLNNKLNEWTSKNAMENGFDLNWLGNIVINSGLAKTEDIDFNPHPSCRGSLTYLEPIINDNHIDAQLVVHTETAWQPMTEMWVKLNEKYNLGLEIIYSAEEPGNELYCTNDPCEANLYNLDVWESVDGLDTEWSVPESYVIKVLQNLLKTTESDINKLLSEYYESDWSEKMSISKWEYVDIDEWY